MSVLKARRTESKAEYINTATNSALSYIERFDNHKRLLKLKRLFYALFGFSAEDKVNFDIADIFQRRNDNEQVHCAQTV